MAHSDLERFYKLYPNKQRALQVAECRASVYDLTLEEGFAYYDRGREKVIRALSWRYQKIIAVMRDDIAHGTL